MKVPQTLSKLREAVSEMSQVDLQKTCVELIGKGAINSHSDTPEVERALNAFKSFFAKIETHRELK